MKQLAVALIVVFLFSCKNEEKLDLNKDFLLGNWSSITKGTYQEYFFDINYIHVFYIRSGNINTFKYYVRNDSIFTFILLPDLTYGDKKYFDKVTKYDSINIHFLNNKFTKIKDSVTLDLLLNKKIDSMAYHKAVVMRKNYFSEDLLKGIEIGLDTNIYK